jgi:hypothetical protein
MANIEEFTILSWGLVYASVCTNLSSEDAVARLNAELPTGVESKWERSSNEFFASGYPNPCLCQDAPATHRHYLFSC